MEGKERPIKPGAVIGREGVEVVLADPEVSRRHAAIRQLDDSAAIEDLGSTNGTFVNGEKITGVVALSEGDEVKIGNTVLAVAAVGSATKAAIAVPDPGTQATTAREVPAPPPAPEPAAAAQPAAPAPGPAPVAAPAAEPVTAAQAPAQPAAGERGDVPAPSLNAPSAIRRVLPAPGAAAPTFNPPPPQKGRSSAATSGVATAVAFVIVLLTLVGVVLYFAL